MRLSPLWVAGAAVLGMPLPGCVTPTVARYVYQDGEFGVVGIPVNTYQQKMSYREQAEELMARHFPEGYEIVRAEEVNEGERILDLARKTEVETEPKLTALNQVFKLGKLDRTTSYQEKDKLMARECRIIYRRKPKVSMGHTGQFAASNSLVPPFYLDPNELVRQQIKTEMVAKATTPAKKVNDADVQKASAEAPKTRATIPISAKGSTSSDW
jgi:hypothetical protein